MDAPPPAPAKLPPRPRRRRSRRWLLFPVVLVVGVLIGLRSDLAARIAGTALQTAVEALIGEEVTVGAVTLSYLPLEVGLEGVVVANRADGARIVGIRSVHARLGVKDWRAGLVRLEIDSPAVALHLDDDGLREFRDRVQRPSSGPTPERFPWMELVVKNGQFRLEGKDLRVELAGLNVHSEEDERLDVAFDRLELQHKSITQRAGPTRFKHVDLTPKYVDVPSIDVRFDHFAADGAVRAEFGGALSGDLAARVALAGFTQSTVDPRKVVDGVLSLDATLGGTLAAPIVDGRLATDNVVWTRLSSAGEPVRLVVGELVGPLHYEDQLVSFGSLRSAWGGGVLDLGGKVDLRAGTLQVDVMAEGVHLGPILRSTGAHLGPWVDFEGDLEAHAVGTLEPFILQGPFKVAGTDLVVKNGPYDGNASVMLEVPRGRLGGNLRVDARHIVLDASDTRFGPARGEVWADIGFARTGPLDVRVHLEEMDLTWLQPLGGAGLGGTATLDGQLSGPFDRLHASADLSVRDAVVIDKAIANTITGHLESDLSSLEFTDLRAELGLSRYQGNYTLSFLPEGLWMDTQLVVTDGRLRDLTGIFVDLPGLDGHVVANAVLHGPPKRLSGEVHASFDAVETWGETFSEGNGVGWMDDGVLTIDDLTLRRGDTSVLARGSVGRGYAMNVEILTDGARVEALDHLRGSSVDLRGEVVADVQVGGTLYDWLPRGRIAVQRAQLRGRNIDDSELRFSTTPDGWLAFEGGLLGDHAAIDGRLQLHGEQPYDLRADLEQFPMHVLYPEGADGNRITFTLDGEVELAGRFGDDPTPVDIEGRFPSAVLTWNQHTLRNEEDWVFAVHGRSVGVPGLSLTDGGRTRLGLEGWTTGDGRTTFRGGGTADLDLVRMFAPGVPLAEGTLELNVEMGTETTSGGVEVKAQTRGATLRTEYFPNTFTNFDIDASATRNGITVSLAKAEVGGGRFEGQGQISAENWRLRRYDLGGTLRNARVQYLDYLPAIVGDADLRFDGPVDDLLLSGDIVIDDMQFRDRIDWESKIVALQSSRLTDGASQERTDYFSMDLGVTANGTVHLRNNLADGDANADLRITGDTARPGMTGSIEVLPGGRMYLQDREFDITRGEIRYLDPFRFDPDLDILLETDVSSREQDYHVYYSVTGPFSNWRTSTTADPFLSQADINTLLLFGMTREEFEQYGGLAASAMGVDLFVSQVTASPAQLVDRWNLVSGINARGTPTLDNNWRIVAEKDFAGFTGTLELELDPSDADWYAGIERRVTRNFFANLYLTSQQEGRALTPGAAAGTELKYRWELD